MTGKKKQSRKSKRQSERIGGREFGNVIEPTQAQMASGNEGLAAKSDKQKKRPGKNAA